MRRWLPAVVVLLVVATRAASHCEIPSSAWTFTCESKINIGVPGICTLTMRNVGDGPCTGEFKAAVGLPFPGVVDMPQGGSPIGSCSVLASFALPREVLGVRQLSSTAICQGSGVLGAGAEMTFSARVTPAREATASTTPFIIGYGDYKGTPPFLTGETTAADLIALRPISFIDCTTVAHVPGAVPSGVPYFATWNSTGSGTTYEVQESLTPDFSGASTAQTSSTSRQFQHVVSSPTTYYYRVRPLTCGGASGSFGPTTQTVILPQQSPTSREFDIVVPLGSTAPVSQDVRFEKLAPGATFMAATDQPFLTVTPASGTVASDGSVTVTVRGNPSSLPVGANTGTVQLTVETPSSGNAVGHATTVASKPVSVSLVTPVSQTPKGAPPADAILIPAVAHLEGAGARFQSDIRLTNASTTAKTYLLTFTPSNTDGTTAGRQTQLTVEPEQTVALNDVLRGFFGFAQPSDSAGGALEIRAAAGSTMTGTYASSRTYATTDAGTYGQFIPAVPLAKFLKAGAGTLTLTQVSQGTAFRSNIGLFEGLGIATSGRLRVFDIAGAFKGEFPFSLKPFEFQQLGSFLAANGIPMNDARVELVVDGGAGGVSTYSSVLDNRTQDPLLATPVQTASLAANRYVLPGMADLDTPVSNFHSDIRIYNASGSPVSATLTFHPQGNPAAAASAQVLVQPQEIKAYDNVLPTLFNLRGIGGSIVLTTPGNTALIVSGRTYSNAAAGGTYGQFIPAVTPAEGIGINDAPLQILQLEQSANFRSNVGIAELSGNPVTVVVSATLADSRATVSTAPIDLPGNGFIQLGSLLAQLNPGKNSYNARVAVRVTGGTGRITAYGSVIDNSSLDPTYVPAQK